MLRISFLALGCLLFVSSEAQQTPSSLLSSMALSRPASAPAVPVQPTVLADMGLRSTQVVYSSYSTGGDSKQDHSAPAGSFDTALYSDLLHLNMKYIGDTTQQQYKFSTGVYTRLLRSPEVGLYNLCEVYQRNDGTAIISLRGTIGKAESWMENFLAAMLPATGSLQLTDNTRFVTSWQ
ncbi:hypothetical protein [Filimonas effusa]|uniref:Uncharacterized protein n=1 Tax=Filimonas effusa TaxID=2508721 RepID=A0A4Q1D5X7_9BACT|nr:hypothetical protein [Filimonas effusa]RXK83808.1 hypothetical protein ESB13_17200 [Filimonas effusa]